MRSSTSRTSGDIRKCVAMFISREELVIQISVNYENEEENKRGLCLVFVNHCLGLSSDNISFVISFDTKREHFSSF